VSSPTGAKHSALTRQDAFAILGSLGALVTIITVVMLYFGWRRSDVQAQDMGIDVSLFGFSTQDYVLRSISSLYLPLLAVFGLALAWSWLHSKVAGMLRRLATANPEARKRVARRCRFVAVTATALTAERSLRTDNAPRVRGGHGGEHVRARAGTAGTGCCRSW
jgi:hypothetical protein